MKNRVFLTEAQKLAVRQRYENGENVKDLASDFGCSIPLVYKIIYASGIQTRNLRQFSHEEMISSYLKGETITTLALKYEVSVQAIHRILRHRKIARRSTRDTQINRLPLNESAFDTITEESAYWIGFLMADGNVMEIGNSYRLSLCLHTQDLSHLERFKSFLGSGHKIHKFATKAASLSVNSRRLCDAIARYGITPRKTFTAHVIGLENNRHFWRGVIDGDGCLYIPKNRYNSPVIHLVGSCQLVNQFRDFALTSIPQSKSKVFPVGNIYKVSLSGIPLIESLYGDCTIALQRKLDKANSVLNRHYSR